MKNRFPILAFAALALIAAAGCSSTQTVGEELDDATITTKIEAKMAGDPEVSAWNVDVDTNEGVVRLCGSVEDPEAKAEAEKLARGTDGVRRVINDIEVGERDLGDRMSDTAITTSIKAKITGDGDLSPFNINVDTKEGVVTLRGTVTSMESKRRRSRSRAIPMTSSGSRTCWRSRKARAPNVADIPVRRGEMVAFLPAFDRSNRCARRPVSR